MKRFLVIAAVCLVLTPIVWVASLIRHAKMCVANWF